jgi:hypothetical protein
MVLELYCRKAGRKREYRKKKERPAMATWRRGGGEGRERRKARDESKKCESLKRERRNQAAPVIVNGMGYLDVAR